MNNTYIISSILIVALMNALMRALPFFIFKDKEIPKTLTYLGRVLPPAIMITLVIYGLRHTNIHIRPYGIPEFVSLALVAILQKIKDNTILSIVLGTLVYMVLIRFL